MRCGDCGQTACSPSCPSLRDEVDARAMKLQKQPRRRVYEPTLGDTADLRRGAARPNRSPKREAERLLFK